MLKIKKLKVNGFETVVVGKDPRTNFHSIIAIHSTRLGPSLGGIRMWPYVNERSAMQDVRRLAAAMTKKAAVSGLPVGGGKAVIIGDPMKDKTRSLLLTMGEFIESLQGRYIGAKDSGILPEDLDVVVEQTRHVTGTTRKRGGSGDPSVATAKGVLLGIQAACQCVYGSKNLKGRIVAIQGIGHVGWNLGRLLYQKGVHLIVADPEANRVEQARRSWKATVVPVSRIHQVQADVFAPCALGGVLNAKTIPQLKAKIVAGGANNQCLDEERDPYRMMERNIVHVPDYVLNAGGLIHLVVREILRKRQVKHWLKTIETTVCEVLTTSIQKGIPPLVMTNRLAKQKIRHSMNIQNA